MARRGDADRTERGGWGSSTLNDIDEAVEKALARLDDGDPAGAVEFMTQAMQIFTFELQDYADDGWVSAREGLREFFESLRDQARRIKYRRGGGMRRRGR
jgi:hypothetical protein